MPIQTTYGERIAPPGPGVIHGSDRDVDTGICETASPGIGFGLAVSQGTLSDQGVVLGGTVAGFRGVTVRDVTLPPENADKYLPPNSMAVLTRGPIWTEPGEAVAANDPVYFHGTTGVFYKSAAAGRVGPLPGSRWKTACGIGGRAIAQISDHKLA
jgi:hypothetical protein